VPQWPGTGWSFAETKLQNHDGTLPLSPLGERGGLPFFVSILNEQSSAVTGLQNNGDGIALFV
jgi:hypothetical protein